MKALEFTIPVPDNKTIIVQEEKLPYFYPHLHRHKEIQLTWIIKGEGTLVTGNAMHAFKSNAIYWIGANQAHVFKSNPSYFKNKQKNKTHSIDIFFNPDTTLHALFSLPELKALKAFIENHQNGFSVPAGHFKAISERMHQIISVSGTDQFIQFIDIIRHLAAIEKPAPLAAQNNEAVYSDYEGKRIAKIYNYIMQHYHQNISLSEVAKLAYMTPHAFCRYFKKHTHHTLISFINHVRINEACKQLVNKKYQSIASLAYDSGFNSITNFNRVFKSVVKKSPKEYLESYFHNTR